MSLFLAQMTAALSLFGLGQPVAASLIVAFATLTLLVRTADEDEDDTAADETL